MSTGTESPPGTTKASGCLGAAEGGKGESVGSPVQVVSEHEDVCTEASGLRVSVSPTWAGVGRSSGLCRRCPPNHHQDLSEQMSGEHRPLPLDVFGDIVSADEAAHRKAVECQE